MLRRDPQARIKLIDVIEDLERFNTNCRNDFGLAIQDTQPEKYLLQDISISTIGQNHDETQLTK